MTRKRTRVCEDEGGRNQRYIIEWIHLSWSLEAYSYPTFPAASNFSLSSRREMMSLDRYVDSSFPWASRALLTRRSLSRDWFLVQVFLSSFHRAYWVPSTLVHCSLYPQRYLHRDSFHFRCFNIPRSRREIPFEWERESGRVQSSRWRYGSKIDLTERERRSRPWPLCDKAHSWAHYCGFHKPLV